MSLEIFPQNVALFPNVRQLFTARQSKLDPMWTNVRAVGTPTTFPNGVVDSDYSVRRTFGSGFVVADAALELVGGVGAVEFTLTLNSLPLSSVNVGLRWTFFFDGTSPQAHDYDLFFFSNRIEIKVASVLIATITRTLAAGDRIRVELSNGFRLVVNDAPVHERSTFASSIQYPATYTARVSSTTDIVGNVPTIPAPRLSGDWQLRPVVLFTAPAHGSISTAGPAKATEYFNATIPGIYKLIAQTGAGVEAWWEDAAPAGSTVTTTGGTWLLNGLLDTPAPTSGIVALKSPLAAGDHQYRFATATTTLQVKKDDIFSCLVFLETANPPTEIMFQWEATDATGLAHRAYWGANSLALGTDGTPSRRFMGPLPATGQWIKLEVPASLVDMEGRVANGAIFSLFDGRCTFDQFGKYPGKLQRAEAAITISPLRIFGENPRTIQPGAKFRPQTNYDDGPGVTWSVVSGGGSFTAGEFTAAATPGTTIVRASGTDNQVADLTINVPAVITPGHKFAAPLEQIDFDTNIPATVVWSSDPAGINSSTGVLTFSNTPGAKVKITATNGTFTATRDVLIVPAFPFTDFTLPLVWDRNLPALISMSEDRSSRITREKAPAYDSYPVKLLSRTLADSNAIDAFFDLQGFGKPFILEDKVRGIRKVGWFDSPIRHEARDECDIDLAFQFLEART